MKKKLLFSMAAISVLAVGLLIWNCGDDGKKEEVIPLSIELTAAPATINADDSNAGNTVTVTAKVTLDGSVQEGKEVSFAVTTAPTGSLASVAPATKATNVNGEATTTLSAGTIAGEVVVTGIVDSETQGTAAVTVTAGALVGIIKVSPVEPTTITKPCQPFVVQLADAYGNAVQQAGVSVTFSTDMGMLATTTVTTDDSGQAAAGLDSVSLGVGEEAEVVATYINTVTFDKVTGANIPIPPTPQEVEDNDPPSFRTTTAIIDPDSTDNKLGWTAPVVNAELNKAVQDGTVNLLYAAIDLEKVTGTNDIMFVCFTGLCGAPAGPITPCTGAETDYYIDPASLDDCGYPLIFTEGQVIDGKLSVSIEKISLGFPYQQEMFELTACNIDIEATVTKDPSWTIVGDKEGGTYCPEGCASLSGFVKKAEFCATVEKLIGLPCETLEGLLGETDGECAGEEAYSVRLLDLAEEVFLYKSP